MRSLFNKPASRAASFSPARMKKSSRMDGILHFSTALQYAEGFWLRLPAEDLCVVVGTNTQACAGLALGARHFRWRRAVRRARPKTGAERIRKRRKAQSSPRIVFAFCGVPRKNFHYFSASPQRPEGSSEKVRQTSVCRRFQIRQIAEPATN